MKQRLDKNTGEEVLVDGQVVGIVALTEYGWCYLRDKQIFGYWREKQGAVDHLCDAVRKGRP